jgi:hypothetical protein
MDFNDQFSLEHLLFKERKCRSCGLTKDLLDGFYLTRKNRGMYPSSYSYECKSCTIKRIANKRQLTKKCQQNDLRWHYPDW